MLRNHVIIPSSYELLKVVLVAVLYIVAVIVGSSLLFADPTSEFLALPVLMGATVVWHAVRTTQLRAGGAAITAFLSVTLAILAVVAVLYATELGIPVGPTIVDAAVSILLAAVLLVSYVILAEVPPLHDIRSG